jgi:Pvc16 N-terminal domain
MVSVIHEVDEALRTLLRREVVNGSDIEVGFEAPTREWSSKRSSPVVDLFLYDIREDGTQRQQGLVRERGPDGRVLRDREPIRKLKLSYLVTAWTQRPEDEHRLLALLLDCFLKYDSLPIEVLAGSLAENATIVALSVGVPSVEDRHVSDLWTAIGGELRPALDVVAVAPIQPGIPRQPAPPVLERTRLNIRRPGGSEETRQGRARPPGEAAARGEGTEEVISAGDAEDGFDGPRPPNGLPRGRTFRVRGIPRLP